jgi:hypothetical protein
MGFDRLAGNGPEGTSDVISLTSLAEGEEGKWAEFLAASPNGTLFHDLRFLAYHPPRRFSFHHLVARRHGKIIALVPGGIVDAAGRRVFASPLGASVGGPAIAAKLDARRTLDLVAALQAHALARGWDGLQLTLPPAVYHSPPADTLGFALFWHGFQLKNRWLCLMIPLADGASGGYTELFRRRQVTRVREQIRKGMTVVEGGIERLPEFLPLFRDTYARHDAAPTHTEDELADLLRRLPDQVRLHIAILDGKPMAGVLLFLLNPQVAYSFCICMSTEHARESGNLVIFAAIVDRLAQQGYRWLDLGPSGQFGRFSDGVAFFKECLGATGHCRDQWYWEASRRPAVSGNAAEAVSQRR